MAKKLNAGKKLGNSSFLLLRNETLGLLIKFTDMKNPKNIVLLYRKIVKDDMPRI